MIAGIDSSYMVPTEAKALQAKGAGVRLWSGYMATKSGVGLAHAWAKSDFDNARLCGATPIAYCSGLDDPVACKARAAQWNVRPCLDVEAGIRPDGSWVQAWLDASGAGLYGNLPVHSGRRAAFHIVAAYPGYDPRKTWVNNSPPPGPHGWQWAGSHSEFGVTVDRGWFDDWFLTGGAVTPTIVLGGGPMLEPQIGTAAGVLDANSVLTVQFKTPFSRTPIVCPTNGDANEGGAPAPVVMPVANSVTTSGCQFQVIEGNGTSLAGHLVRVNWTAGIPG